MRTSGRMLGLAASCLVLQSCGDPKSSSTGGPEGGPVPTNRMTINVSVESSTPTTAVARATLNDGKSLGSSYRLDGGDFFRTCVNGVCKTMADNDSLDSPDYIARFDFQPGVDYVVSFTRQDGQNAPDSRIVLPPAFTIVTPANHQQVTDGESVIVSWTPTGAPARVALSYQSECTFAAGPSFSSVALTTDANGDGRETVRIDPIIEAARTGSATAPSRCSIDVTVSHERQGRIDPAFRNGTAVGIVSREVNLVYIPR